VCCAILLAHVAALAEDPAPKRFRFFGDFRFRIEQDWDSLEGDGTERDDRLRARIRLRVGFDAIVGSIRGQTSVRGNGRGEFRVDITPLPGP